MPAFRERPNRRSSANIRWHDDGSALRVRRVFADDGTPYRALALAGVMAVLSIVAVTAAIQFHRQGGLPEMGNLVDEARADPAPAKTEIASANKPTVKTAGAAGFVGAPAKPEAQAPSPAPAVAAVAAQPEPIIMQPAAPAIAETESRILAKSDPRWHGDVAAAVAQSKRGEDSPQVLALNEPEPKATNAAVDSLARAASGAAEATAETVNAVPTPRPVRAEESQPVEKPKEVAALDASAPVNEKPKVEKAKAEKGSARSGAHINRSVFLRSRPSDGGAVLVTIPSGAAVQVAQNCEHWCSVTYAGKTGYVYKRFISR